MVKGKFILYKDGMEDIVRIRKEVFQKELNCSILWDIDDKDNIASHVLVESEDGKFVATGRMILEYNYCWIDKIAVLKEYRNMKYGDFVLRMLINKAILSNISLVKIKCKNDTVSFFEKVGFKIIDKKKSFVNMELNVKEIKQKCNCNK